MRWFQPAAPSPAARLDHTHPRVQLPPPAIKRRALSVSMSALCASASCCSACVSTAQLLLLVLLGARPPPMKAAQTHHRDVRCSQAAAAAGGSSGCGGTGGGRRLVRCSTGSRSRSSSGAAPGKARRRQAPCSGGELPERRARLEGAEHAQLVHWAVCATHSCMSKRKHAQHWTECASRNQLDMPLPASTRQATCPAVARTAISSCMTCRNRRAAM